MRNKDTVIVSNGTYEIDTQLSITKEQILVRSSTGDPADVIIDCGENCRAFYSNQWASRLVGFTVRNGLTNDAGGGICLSSSALVSNCVVRSCAVIGGANHAYGGGIRCATGSEVVNCLVEDCIVSNATSTTSSFRAQGGGIYNIGQVLGCTVRRCSVYSRNGYYGLSAGGGIYVESNIADGRQYPAGVMNCRVYSNTVATLTETYASEGGGICIRAVPDVEAPQVVSNCLVFANAAGWAGGGVSLIHSAQLLDCTILSNKMDNMIGLLDPHVELMGGGGVFVWGTGGSIIRCRIEGNRVEISGDGKQPQGGGGIRLSGSETLVADSVIRGNHSNKRGAAVYFGQTTSSCAFDGAVISNCWIEANTSESSGIIIGCEAGGLQIVNCGIVSNEVANSSLLYWYRTKDLPEGVLFRNTLFQRNANTASGTLYGLGLSAT